MNKKYILIFALIAAVVLIAGCTQQAPSGEQPAADITASALGDQLTSAQTTDTEMGDVDTSALDDVTGTL